MRSPRVRMTVRRYRTPPSVEGGRIAQTPPMQRRGGVFAQQSPSVVHLSSTSEQGGGVLLHLPFTQKPPQQSMPLVQTSPLLSQGVSVAKARMFPDASS